MLTLMSSQSVAMNCSIRQEPK